MVTIVPPKVTKIVGVRCLTCGHSVGGIVPEDKNARRFIVRRLKAERIKHDQACEGQAETYIEGVRACA